MQDDVWLDPYGATIEITDQTNGIYAGFNPDTGESNRNNWRVRG
jgi:hypothetical protein